MGVQFIQVDKNGTLVYTAPDRWDSSNTPLVILYSPQGGVLQDTVSCVEGPSTTINAACAAGAATLAVAGTTNFSVGATYRVGPNGSGQFEWITANAITTNAVRTRDDLQYSYETNNVLASTKLSVTVYGSNITASNHNCLAKWTYEVDGLERTDTTIWHASTWLPRLTVNEQDILKREPRAIDLLGSRQRLEQLILDVWENEILEEIGQSVPPGAVVSGGSLHMCVVYRVLMEIYTAGQDHEHAAVISDLFKQSWARMLQQAPMDVDENGVISSDDIVAPSMCGRLYRG